MGFGVRFWGVRGSIPAPGPKTAQVGGNTSCVEVLCGSTRLILDAGTGIRALGDELVARGQLQVHLLLSHYHWDHIQGLPFFAPSYLPSANLHVFGAEAIQSVEKVLRHQMAGPLFPVAFDDLLSHWSLEHVACGDRFRVGDAVVSAALLDHPGGVLAFRIEHAGHSVVYATDTEQWPSADPALLELAHRADLLIYDSQYTPREYEAKRGWGHSTYEAGCAIARAAKVERYVLFHHDPQRSDAQVAQLEDRARRLFAGAFAAREGQMIELDPFARAA
jgi:phosphoribosyl 1,2-cyclic phosphodiesterase